MTNWQVQPPPDNDGHARRYNPDTGRTDPFLVGLGLLTLAVIGVSLFYGLRLVYRDKIVGIVFTVLTLAVGVLHFLLDVPYVGVGYLLIILVPIAVVGCGAAVIDAWKYFDRKYKEEEEGR